MFCPFCSHSETRVNDSRLVAEGMQVRRRRECLACGERFTSFESAELLMPRVIKSDGSREPFNEEKLRWQGNSIFNFCIGYFKIIFNIIK
ncbi:MAG: hypothetical protein ACPHAN_06065, partial [Pseudomonadales bacterium]